MPQQLSLEEILGKWGKAIAAKAHKRRMREVRRQPSPQPVRTTVTASPLVIAPPRPAYDPNAPTVAEAQAAYDHLLAEWDRMNELSSPRANALQVELRAARFQLGVAAYRAASRGE